MKREKRLTKRERKALFGTVPSFISSHEHEHIHCIACGRHLNGFEFTQKPATAMYLTCQHGGQFPTCAMCIINSRKLIEEHDRSGNNVQSASAWH